MESPQMRTQRVSKCSSVLETCSSDLVNEAKKIQLGIQENMLPPEFSFELTKGIIHSLISITCPGSQKQVNTFLETAICFDDWCVLTHQSSCIRFCIEPRLSLMTESHFCVRKTKTSKCNHFSNCTLASKDGALLALT